MMSRLPNEIWAQILEYLEPSDLLNVQRVSRNLLKAGRDSQLWKAKVFEQSPSAAHAFSRGNGLADLLNGLSLSNTRSSEQDRSGRTEVNLSRRDRAIVRWDCTDKDERVDWYSEYIARHAALSVEWQGHESGNEIRSMALFENETKILSAMENGSLKIWDIKTAMNGRRRLQQSAQSRTGLLFDDFSSSSGPSSAKDSPNVGQAIDSTLVDASGTKAYVAIVDKLNEVDLNTMAIISQQKFAWNITAISQQSGHDLPLMIGTSFTLNMYDPRMPLKLQPSDPDDRTDSDDKWMVFLPNYAKQWLESQPRPARMLGNRPSRIPGLQPSRPGTLFTPVVRSRVDPEVWAPVEPGPQTILHRGVNEIIVAGRMPSILFYDKRTFPRLESGIHSKGRLSALTSIPYRPHGATSSLAEATLVAAGEYNGRGSLEIYELPFHRPSDRQPSYDWPPNEAVESGASPSTQATSEEGSSEAVSPDQEAPYSHQNRQSSSSAKLLSVATQGARIVFSDSEGGLKWVERDGRGLARRWNINSYQYTHSGGALVGDAVARKLLTFSSDATYSTDDREGMARGDGDLLVWTGSDIGILTSKVKWTGHDELVSAFERQMTLEDASTPDGADRKRIEEERQREEEYSRTMRRALERQADERRFLARFGRSAW